MIGITVSFGLNGYANKVSLVSRHNEVKGYSCSKETNE